MVEVQREIQTQQLNTVNTKMSSKSQFLKYQFHRSFYAQIQFKSLVVFCIWNTIFYVIYRSFQNEFDGSCTISFLNLEWGNLKTMNSKIIWCIFFPIKFWFSGCYRKFQKWIWNFNVFLCRSESNVIRILQKPKFSYLKLLCIY